MTDDEVELTGGNSNVSVVKVGDTVRRQMSRCSPTVHRFLQYLHEHDFTAAPQFLGIDDSNREILSYQDGQCLIDPEYWQDERYLISAANLLKRYHDATRQFVSDGHEVWGYVYPDQSRHEVICHNDFGVYNLIADEYSFVAVIDFDLAGPGPRIRDVAYAAYWLVPLSQRATDMQVAAKADVANGCSRLKQFCALYGVPVDAAFLDMVQEVLNYMGSMAAAVDSIGQEGAARLMEEGHVPHWQGEALAFKDYRPSIESSLAL